MATKPKCLKCGSPRDRGPYTKYCKGCFVSPCNRCGQDNLRGPYTFLCQECYKVPYSGSRQKCKRCELPNDRAPKAALCQSCSITSEASLRKARSLVMSREATPGLKWCSLCESYLDLDRFYLRNRNALDNCKDCIVATSPPSSKSAYGLTEAQYRDIFEAQGNSCAICGNTPNKQRFHVDHDHTTGMVRGILCLWCNHKVLGGARDSAHVLKSAVAYLESPPAVLAVGEVFGKVGGRKGTGKGVLG